MAMKASAGLLGSKAHAPGASLAQEEGLWGSQRGASAGLLARKHLRCLRTPLSGCACVTATQACSSKAAALSISDTSRCHVRPGSHAEAASGTAAIPGNQNQKER